LTFEALKPPPGDFLARLDSFETDVWADAGALAQACRGMSLEELRRMLDRALAVRDLKRIAVASRAMPADEPVTRTQAYLAGQALLSCGRYAEAAAALTRDHIVSFAPNIRYVRARIRALAGAGELEEALETARAIRAAHPEMDLLGLSEALQAILDLRPREAKLEDWTSVRPLAEAYVLLDLAEDARGVLERASRRLGSGLAGEDLLSWADLALRVLPAEAVAARLEEAPAAAGPDDRWRTLATAARALASPALPPGPGEADGAGDKNLRFWRALASERRGNIDGAIVQLCDLSEEHKTDLDIRGALARCVGKLVLDKVRPRFGPGRTGRIVNLVPFYNELAMLRLHLEEMSPWVDRFVIVEAAKTFTGMDKPLVFEANQGLFADFADKIVHVPVRQFPAHLTAAWSREFYQRDMAIAGASGLCGEDDYILETDVDEIVDRPALEGIETDFAALDLNLSRFFLNYRPAPGNPERTALKSTLFKAKHLSRHGVSYGRSYLAHRYSKAHVVPDAGWHFTSMFDAPGISLKVQSYAHQEHGKAKFRSIPHFQALRGRLRAGEFEPGWERVDLDGSFPRSLHRHLDEFADVIL
jgi:beta-1,4-mannosyl-glycoprotein beta-1,4-N-acetylglucosaminyltransferase